MELLKDPLIVVRGEELVARELLRARAPASGSGTTSISRPKSDGGRSCSIQQLLTGTDSRVVYYPPCSRVAYLPSNQD